MRNLRTLHFYLGCILSPLILFFTLSGIWQTLGLHTAGPYPLRGLPAFLSRLSTIHTSRGLKAATLSNLSSPLLRIYVLIMAAGLLLTITLGIILALRTPRYRTPALVCLALGTAMPLALVVGAILR